MGSKKIEVCNLAEAYLVLLAERGVEYLFGNAGTDFAPLVEAYSRSPETGPKPISVPHENIAVSMAHGYYMVSQRMQAVMLHTNVGTANGLCALMNASRANTPILFTAGHSPLTEAGLLGSRDAPIHWSQEMFDQAGMLREVVKWDYKLVYPEQLQTVVDRAINIATSEPKGPVYLSLPREVLGTPMESFSCAPSDQCGNVYPPYPHPEAIRTAAKMIVEAKRPLIVTTYAGQNAETVEQLGLLAEQFSIPVTHKWMRTVCLPTDHPMHVGFDTAGLLENADLVIVLDCDVPWIPHHENPPADAKVIHIGSDPLFSRYPLRGFRSDLSITGISAATLRGIREALGAFEGAMKEAIGSRRAAAVGYKAAMKQRREQRLVDVRNQKPIHPSWVSHCINEVMQADTILVAEPSVDLHQLDFSRPHTFFFEEGAGGLGWGLGAALGAKLARPDQLVITTMGDGTYLFNSPLSGHSVGKMYDLPVLTIIFNNGIWGAVRQATHTMYPRGYAAKDNAEAFVGIDGTPNLEHAVAVAGGYGERVTDPAELPAALQRALKVVQEERRHAVLNVVTAPPSVNFFGQPMGSR